MRSILSGKHFPCVFGMCLHPSPAYTIGDNADAWLRSVTVTHQEQVSPHCTSSTKMSEVSSWLDQVRIVDANLTAFLIETSAQRMVSSGYTGITTLLWAVGPFRWSVRSEDWTRSSVWGMELASSQIGNKRAVHSLSVVIPALLECGMHIRRASLWWEAPFSIGTYRVKSSLAHRIWIPIPKVLWRRCCPRITQHLTSWPRLETAWSDVSTVAWTRTTPLWVNIKSTPRGSRMCDGIHITRIISYPRGSY